MIWVLAYLGVGMVSVGLYAFSVALEDDEPDYPWCAFLLWPLILPVSLGFLLALAIKSRRKPAQ